MEITSSSMLSSALGLFIISLLTAHFVTPHPISKLGKRPLGTGLLTYTYSQLFSSFTGCWGYDSSLGSFNPIWRLSFHISFIMSLSSIIMFCFGSSYWSFYTFLQFSFVYGICIHLYWNVLSKGVSHPGGPREHKIRRMPKWDNQSSIVTSWDHWRCAVAQDSHRATLKRFKLDPTLHGENGVNDNDIGLSGEPYGRQMWTTKANDDVDDDGWTKVIPHLDLIQEMAKGGRGDFDFNPSINPNSSDMIFREQMIKNYVANGGSLPDVQSKCETIKDAMKKAVHFFSMIQTEDGHWAGDYGGPHFLMPGLVITW